MGRNRYSGEYKISKHEYLMARHFALCYNEWLAGCAKMENSDPERKELRRKMKTVEQTALEADGELYQYLLKAVTNEGITYAHLQMLMDIPCGDQKYYRARRKFYYLLSKKI